MEEDVKIQKKLTKLGIVKIEELKPEMVNYIAHSVTNNITTTFLTLQMQYNEILAKMLNCKMYYAKIPSNIAKVNYIYEDNSMYIDENIDILKLDEQFYHEVIHCLQVVRKNNGKIKKVGLCHFGDFAINGLGINEAIVQYMAAKIMKNEQKKVNIYGIKLQTISPNYFPLITNLMEQIIYYIGEDVIVQAAINVNENFEDMFYNTFEEKTNEVIRNFDKILEIRNKLSTETNEQVKSKLEKKIYDIYLETQELMLIKYYEQIIPRLTTEKEVDFYIEKLLKNKVYLGMEEKEEFTGTNFYERNKEIIMERFNQQLTKINKQKQRKALIVYNHKIKEFLKKTISYFWN